MNGVRVHQPALGIALVIAATSCFAMMDTTVRYIGALFSVGLVLWTRYALHAAIMSVWIAVSKDKTFRTANPLFQIARGALLAFASAMAFVALRHMPVAEFTAIVMLSSSQLAIVRWPLARPRRPGAIQRCSASTSARSSRSRGR